VTIQPDGIDAAANNEVTFHPKTASGKQITAWDRRASTLKVTIAKVNELQTRLAALEARPVPRPFP
jgi:hypothetical protein